MNKKILGLDGLRGLSVLAVIFSHAEILSRLGVNQTVIDLTFLHLGVNSFFVLSGFLITILLIREKDQTGSIDIRGFMMRRVLRIFPLYFLAIFILAALSYLGLTGIISCSFIHAITYTVNFAPIACQTSTMSHFWSLAVEEHFYLVWPFIFLINVRFALAVAVAFTAACIYFGTSLYGQDFSEFKVNRWSFPAASSITIGCICAFICNHVFVERIAKLKIAAVLIAIGICAQVTYRSQLIADFLIVAMILYIYHNQSGRLVKTLEVKPLAAIGIISYGLYVWQGVFSGNGPYRESVPFSPRNIDIGLLITFIVAPISYWYFERPLLALKERFRQRP